MDLTYLLKGITNGTVSIIDFTLKDNRTICSCIKPEDVVLTKRYDVLRFEKEHVDNHIDYLIIVIER